MQKLNTTLRNTWVRIPTLYTYFEEDILTFLTFGFFMLRMIRITRLLRVVLKINGEKQEFSK